MWAAIAAAAASVIGSYMQSEAEKKAGTEAAKAQEAAAEKGIAEQQRQFNSIQQLMAPYVSAGNTALKQQMALIGLGGTEAQQTAINNIQSSPTFQTLTKQGETAILQNASATGGLRGGNVQSALAQYAPAMLEQEINTQYNRLAGISSMGQAAAGNQAQIGSQTGSNISNLLSSSGNAAAQSALLTGQANAQFYGNLANTAGYLGSAYLYSQNNQNTDAFTGKQSSGNF